MNASVKSMGEVAKSSVKAPLHLAGATWQGAAAFGLTNLIGGNLFAINLGISAIPSQFLSPFIKSSIQNSLKYAFAHPINTMLGVAGIQVASKPEHLKGVATNVGKVLYHGPAALYNIVKASQEINKGLNMPKEYKTFVYGNMTSETSGMEGTVVMFPAICQSKNGGKEYSILSDMKPDALSVGDINESEFTLTTTPAIDLVGIDSNNYLLVG